MLKQHGARNTGSAPEAIEDQSRNQTKKIRKGCSNRKSAKQGYMLLNMRVAKGKKKNDNF